MQFGNKCMLFYNLLNFKVKLRLVYANCQLAKLSIYFRNCMNLETA